MRLTAKRKEILTKLESNDSGLSLLRHYPYKYDILQLGTLSLQAHNEKVTIEGKIITDVINTRSSNSILLTVFHLIYQEKLTKVVLFNRVGWAKVLKKGMNIVAYGKYDFYNNSLSASTIIIGSLNNGVRIIPFYSLPTTIKQLTFTNFVKSIIANNADNLHDSI